MSMTISLLLFHVPLWVGNVSGFRRSDKSGNPASPPSPAAAMRLSLLKETAFCHRSIWNLPLYFKANSTVSFSPSLFSCFSSTSIQFRFQKHVLTSFSVMRYEIKYAKQDMTIYRLVMRRNPSEDGIGPFERSILRLMAKTCIGQVF